MKYIYLLLFYVNSPLKSKKNIAFVIYSLDSGGAERVVATLSNFFVIHYNVYIITIIEKKSFYDLDKRITILPCFKSSQDTSSILKRFKNNIKLYFKINTHLEKEGIDLAISFMTTSNVLTALACRYNNIRCIISERSNPYIYIHNWFWRMLIKYSYSKADYLIVQSKLIKNYYKAVIVAHKILVLQNPLSDDLISKKENSPAKKNIVLTVGRLDSNKAQHVIIKAFSNIKNTNWQLIIIGDGHLMSYYKNLVQNLKLDDKVIFTGTVHDVAHFYNDSKIFAFTSRSEGFPNALTEAMYFGLACISTDCPTGPSELIEDGISGYLIDVDDQKSLENKLSILMNDAKLITHMGAKAFESAKKFKTNRIANQWRAVIEELL